MKTTPPREGNPNDVITADKDLHLAVLAGFLHYTSRIRTVLPSIFVLRLCLPIPPPQIYDGEVICGPATANRYLRTIRSFHPTPTTFNYFQPLGRHIRRPRSDLDLICPSSRQFLGGNDYPQLSPTLRLIKDFAYILAFLIL